MKFQKLVVLIIISMISVVSFAQTAKQLDEFDQFVKKGFKDWELPGLAVVVVKNNKVIYKKGLGVRELGKPDLVDTQTIFACASTTKAMTAVALGMLVDEGKLKWDDKVVKHFPEFRLYDPYMTNEIMVRDLLTHSTGVGNADFLWGFMDVKSSEVLAKMAMVEPSYSMRSSFIYQNIFYLAAGKVIEKVSGKPWSDFLRERIFSPLGMTRTVPYYKEAVKLGNMTAPHFKVKGKIEVIQHFSADEIGPAGSVWSSIDDMGKWVMCMLDSSKFTGGRLLSAATWTEMFKPQVLVPDGQFYPSMVLTKPNWKSYAFGWFQHDYKGTKINFHTGSLDGAIAINAQLPEHKLGIYVFGNLDHAEFRHALIYKSFDLFALGGTRDWSADLKQVYAGLHQANETTMAEFESKRQLNTKPTLPIEKLAGKYHDDLYGDVTVQVAQEKLSINVNEVIKTTLDHWHFNTFRGTYDKKWWGEMTVNFVLNEEGAVSTISVDGLEFKKTK